MSDLLAELTAYIDDLPEKEKEKLAKQLSEHDVVGKKWVPSPGPQMDAYFSEADVLLYGGQAGGGKSALLVGLALTQHEYSLIMRRQYSDNSALIEDLLRQYGTRDGFSGAIPARLRTIDGRLIEFGGAKDPGDEESWQGQAHDFLGVDEATQFLESQIRYLLGWNRPRSPGQRSRAVLATNPPIDPATGQWIVDMFGPWLNPAHPFYPTAPGVLRYVISDDKGNDKWVDGPEPIEQGTMPDGSPRMVKPQSRTFIPAALSDNPFLEGTGYDSKLDSLPEPLRSAVRDGNWMIAHEDHEWQVIPTNWVLQAQQRWTREPPDAPMCTMGVDVAQGGADNTVLIPRYDMWFGEPVVKPGRETPLGSDVASLVIKHRKHNADVVIDMGGGYGGGAYECLKDNNIPVTGYKGSEKSTARTKDRQLTFVNKRAESWWRMREMLDPDQEGGSPVMLPPDSSLAADLVSVRYKMTPRGIQIEDKGDVKKRLGRSPDLGDAAVMALSIGKTYLTHGQRWRASTVRGHFPKVVRSYENRRRPRHV